MNPPAVVAGPLRRAAGLPIVAPLTGRDFRLVWFGESISLLGDQFHLIALSWLVLGLTGSGLALGAILVAAAIPRGIFMLLGGVLSDRISPRHLALASNVMRAVVTTVVAGLVIGEQVQIWHLALAGIVFGTVDAVFLPAINTLVPRLVPVDRLPAANALMQGTAQLMNTVGPAVAGIAIALIGVGAAFAIDAASFAVAAIALWLVRSGSTPGRPASPTPDVSTGSSADLPSAAEMAEPSLLTSLKEGVRVVLGDPLMRSIVIVSTAVNLAFTGSIVVGLPWLVLVSFDGDAAALGLLFSAFGAGALIGVLLAGSFPQPPRLGWIVLTFVALMGLGLAAVGIAPTIPLAGAILFAMGTMNGYVNVTVIAWVQARTDPEMLGRTMSFLMLGSVVAAPVSIALAAALVDSYATIMFLAAGLLVIGSCLVGIASGLPRRMT